MAGIFGVKENVALKDKNTFHVAATTRWYGEFSSAGDLKAFYDDPRFRALPKFILGGGSNLLIGELIEKQFLGNSYNLNVGSAMSLVLMIIVLLCMSFTSSFDEDEMEGVS